MAKNHMTNRRIWAQQALAALALQACGTVPGHRTGAHRDALLRAPSPHLLRPLNNPFSLGIASSVLTEDSVILWTRVLPSEFDVDSPPVADVLLRWELASEESFQNILKSGEARALASRAHCVHIKVKGLTPARPYFYRFHCGDFSSVVGTTRTSPQPSVKVDQLRIGFASCQHWEFGHFHAYSDLAQQQPDLVLFLGDYIYEGAPYSGPGQRARRHKGVTAKSLNQYRARYALYKSDPHLQRAHACAPWVNIWDDHEVDNDYASLTARDRDPAFEARRRAAYQAYFEHMPVDFEALLGPGAELSSKIYHALDWGTLAKISFLDTRQYRDVQACVPPGRGGAFAESACPARSDPSRSLLGMEQERWLEKTLGRSQAQWNLVAQQTLVTSLSTRLESNPTERVWMDGWDGYSPAKQRFLASLAQPNLRNPLVLGGDVHSQWIGDLRQNQQDLKSKIIATELCGTSMTSSSGITQKQAERAMRENPAVRYGNAERHGYNLLEIKPGLAKLSLRVSEDLHVIDAPVSTLASFTIENGRPGAIINP
jgi:alkaline phosphatase D